jgi:hypothetical protein
MLDIVFHNPTTAAHYLGTKPTDILLVFRAHTKGGKKSARADQQSATATAAHRVRFMKTFNKTLIVVMIMPT